MKCDCPRSGHARKSDLSINTWYCNGPSKTPGTAMDPAKHLVLQWTQQNTWYCNGPSKTPGTAMDPAKHLVLQWTQQNTWYCNGPSKTEALHSMLYTYSVGRRRKHDE